MPKPRTTYILAVLVIIAAGYLFLVDQRFESTVEREAMRGRVLRLNPEEVNRILIRRDYWTRRLLERVDQTTFRVSEPVPGAADMPLVMQLLSSLEFLTSVAVLQGQGQDRVLLYDYGLDPPKLEVGLELSDGEEIHLWIGGEPPVGGGIYLMVQGEPDIHVVQEGLLQLLLRLLGVADSTG